jgi:hypothetical protein
MLIFTCKKRRVNLSSDTIGIINEICTATRERLNATAAQSRTLQPLEERIE